MSNTIDLMMKKAKQAMDNAYAPYSKYKVGACVQVYDDTLNY